MKAFSRPGRLVKELGRRPCANYSLQVFRSLQEDRAESIGKPSPTLVECVGRRDSHQELANLIKIPEEKT